MLPVVTLAPEAGLNVTIPDVLEPVLIVWLE